MDDTEMRNQLLGELIDKMQGRLADKEFPDEKKEPEAPVEEEKAEVPAEDKPAEPAEEDEGIADADLDALMKAAD